MIRAIVVDDEKLVRKGFISMIDWERYGILIVGEAADAKSALSVLAQTPVDLLFTDITMPGQSGFELMKQVRRQFPRVQTVVLTCHHEFDYVQEALRLGAIDYIVKTLFELESTAEVMSRIVERFRWEQGSRKAEEDDAEGGWATDRTLVFIPNSDRSDSGELYRLPGIPQSIRMEKAGIYWLVPILESERTAQWLQELDELKEWRAAQVVGVAGESVADMERAFTEGIEDALYYVDGSSEGMQTIGYEALRNQKTSISAKEGSQLNERMIWALSSRDLRQLLERIESERPAPASLALAAEQLCREWHGLLITAAERGELSSLIPRIRTWPDFQQWLRRFADCAQRRMVELGLSKEVMLSLLSAVQYMRVQVGTRINQHDVASHVGMSRSYFSQCFSRFAGESFGETLRSMRIEHAKRLLLETDDPIYSVASLAGFDDDKYFSKLFRDRVGLLPTEFRSRGGNLV
ncbi:two-component system response regulator YesN [Paenibacillus phyllosphaerae]|uniref:Two-component system response regulator YesN n=1 Tax=Paenibacillus phyllosphaerae TaxID=274593 RepID=A0A7W5AZI9_9BACL|nr:response regulator [Paenibacillus phyllosphaerae]MBB3111650.1 two-component system response regulator YesN [Paenibacillus phyllosphaerae]